MKYKSHRRKVMKGSEDVIKMDSDHGTLNRSIAEVGSRGINKIKFDKFGARFILKQNWVRAGALQ